MHVRHKAVQVRVVVEGVARLHFVIWVTGRNLKRSLKHWTSNDRVLDRLLRINQADSGDVFNSRAVWYVVNLKNQIRSCRYFSCKTGSKNCRVFAGRETNQQTTFSSRCPGLLNENDHMVNGLIAGAANLSRRD